MGFSGERVRIRRKEMGLSAVELGMAVKVQQPQIARIEKGTRKPSSDLLPSLARALKCPIDYFYPEMDAKTASAGGFEDGKEEDENWDWLEL